VTAIRKLGYRAPLDGVRSLAVGLVVFHHLGFTIARGGGNGVIVFFVLSGFLITKLIIEEIGRVGTLRVGRFYGRRFARLLPGLALLVIVVALLAPNIVPGANRKYLYLEIVLAFTYLTNFVNMFGGFPKSVDRLYLSHTWSLAVEEHFYLLWPGLYLIVQRRFTLRSIMKALAWFAFAVAVIRVVLDVVGLADMQAFSLFNFDGFAIGAIAAIALHEDFLPNVRARMSRPVVAVAGAAVLGLDTVLGKWTHELPGYLWYVYTGLASLALIIPLVESPTDWPARLFANKLLVYLGKLSYSIYLWHVPVIAYFNRGRYPDWSRPKLAATGLVLSFVFAAASYHLVETRFTKLRERLRS
jgi:peptidoglycan/LPS O-acetylase OafA/YrhL